MQPGSGFVEPALPTTIKTAALRLAADMLGGPRMLRERLQVSPAELAAWLTGAAEPPPQVFLRAMEIILDALDARAAARPPARKD